MAAAIVLFLGGLLCGLCMAVVGFLYWIKDGPNLAAVITWFAQSLAAMNRHSQFLVRTDAGWVGIKADHLSDSILSYGCAAGLNTIKEQHD